MKCTQCERCKDWERLGLSRYCPSCDAEYLAAPLVEPDGLIERLHNPTHRGMEDAKAMREAAAALTQLRRDYRDEIAIVDRIWRVLGIATYEQAGGREISEIVAGWKARAEAAEARLAAVERERDKADQAIAQIGAALGSTDEWSDQETMIFDVLNRAKEAGNGVAGNSTLGGGLPPADMEVPTVAQRLQKATEALVAVERERDDLRAELKLAEERHRVGLRLAFDDSAAEAKVADLERERDKLRAWQREQTLVIAGAGEAAASDAKVLALRDALGRARTKLALGYDDAAIDIIDAALQTEGRPLVDEDKNREAHDRWKDKSE